MLLVPIYTYFNICLRKTVYHDNCLNCSKFYANIIILIGIDLIKSRLKSLIKRLAARIPKANGYQLSTKLSGTTVTN